MQKTIIAAVLAAVLAGALGFFGGVTYQKTQATSFGGSSRFAGGFNRSGGAGGAGGSGIATGTVLSQDASSITVKGADGGSKTIFFSPTTSVSKQQVLKPTDIKVGDEIGAFGQAANGGITATMIQIIPPGGTFRFGGGARGFGGGGAGGIGQGGSSGTPGQ